MNGLGPNAPPRVEVDGGVEEDATLLHQLRCQVQWQRFEPPVKHPQQMGIQQSVCCGDKEKYTSSLLHPSSTS